MIIITTVFCCFSHNLNITIFVSDVFFWFRLRLFSTIECLLLFIPLAICIDMFNLSEYLKQVNAYFWLNASFGYVYAIFISVLIGLYNFIYFDFDCLKFYVMKFVWLNELS